MLSHHIERPSQSLLAAAVVEDVGRAQRDGDVEARVRSGGPMNSGGVTPMMVNGTLFRLMVRPMASAAPPN